MSIDPKKFGLSDSLVNAVSEALKGNQHKIDVAEPKGKITSADFKKLRGEGAKPDYIDLDKDGNKTEPMKQAAKQAKESVEENFKFKVTTKKHGEATVTVPAHKAKTQDEAEKVVRAHPMYVKNKPTKIVAVKEDSEVTEAEDAVAKQIAAKKDALKKQLQQKIAQKQMSAMQAKAQKRLSSINASNDKCTCDSTNENKMKCEVHGGKHKDMDAKMGREKVEMNPPLKEAEDLPKKVIKKGHEIAKSLIKHRAKVREPYAVGMAAAKKSAGIKEDAEQVDEISTMKAVRTAVKRQTAAHGAAIERGDELSDKEQSKVNKSQALIKKKYGEKGDKIVYKAVGKRIGYQD